MLALQLEELARLFSGDSLVEGIVPLVLSMCQDPVASVREQSITAVSFGGVAGGVPTMWIVYIREKKCEC